MTLVDTNIWLDMLKNDPTWCAWSVNQLRKARETGDIAINLVIYAELAPLFDTHVQQKAYIEQSRATLQPLNEEISHLAGHAFKQYRQKGGTKTGVMPDFFIGAQAQVLGLTLLTRDAARYKTYFPKVKLICPQT